VKNKTFKKEVPSLYVVIKMPRIKEKLPRELPHQVIDDLLDDLNKTGRDLGEKLASILDDLPLGREGPHRSVDAVMDGVLLALTNVGEGISEGLNKPAKEVEGKI